MSNMCVVNYKRFGELEEIISNSILSKNLTKTNKKIVGILFMREDQKIVKDNILPSLDYFDIRSSNHIDIFLPGWAVEIALDFGDIIYKKYNFNNASFVDAELAFAAESNWKYSGGVDLLLIDAVSYIELNSERSEQINSDFPKGPITEIDTMQTKYFLDLQAAICIKLDDIVRNNPDDSFEKVLKRIIDFTSSFDSSSGSVKFFSSQEIRVSLFRAITDGLFGLSPKDIKQRLNYAKQFIIKDISKPGMKASRALNLNQIDKATYYTK